MAGVGLWAVLLSALATLAVAGLVLFLDFGHRVHRSFALFLFLRAMLDGFLFFQPSSSDLAGRLRMYWYIAVPFAALHFALAYGRRHGRALEGAPQWGAGLAILAAVVAIETAYLLDHGLAGTVADPGPLMAFVALRWPVYGGLALLFAVQAGNASADRGRKALELAALGMSLVPLFVVSFELVDGALRGFGPLNTLGVAGLAADAATLLFLAEAARRLLRRPSLGRLPFLATWGVVLATVAATVIAFAAFGAPAGQDVLQVLFAGWSLALPVLVTYALVKHRLFDAEVKLRFAIKGSTVAAVFLAVFFVVSQIAQNFLSTRGGLVVGGVVTGLVLFAIHPLQHFADRLAIRAVPGGLPRATQAERRQIYREQLEVAWADGRLTAKERLLFGRLQERLGLSAEEAARLETEVLSALAKSAARTPAVAKAAAEA